MLASHWAKIHTASPHLPHGYLLLPGSLHAEMASESCLDYTLEVNSVGKVPLKSSFIISQMRGPGRIQGCSHLRMLPISTQRRVPRGGQAGTSPSANSRYNWPVLCPGLWWCRGNSWRFAAARRGRGGDVTSFVATNTCQLEAKNPVIFFLFFFLV